jgi:sulfur relay (sulfurtransferase) DsrC/TusE family protein
MVELAEIQVAYYMVAATGVLVAAFYYIYNMRASERNKKIQLSISIADRIGSKEFMRDYVTLLLLDWKDTDDFLKKYDASVNTEASREHFAQRHAVWLAYDNVGYLMHQGLLDEEIVFNAAGHDSIDIWARYWPVINYYRKREVGPRWYENFEFLAKTMWKMAKTRGQVSPGFKEGLISDRYKDLFEPEGTVTISP